MNQPLQRKVVVVCVAVFGVLGGAVAGFLAAHQMMAEMPGVGAKRDVNRMDMNGMAADDTRPMKDMEPMPGMSATPSGAIAVPAVARQLIGVASAPVVQATLEQEIRTVGTVDYDERGFSQVTLKVPGWIKEVFVDSIGKPVRKGNPLFTIYSPDLLTSQDEYLLAIKTQVQVAASPLEDARANAVSLVTSARERLRLWDVTDAQIAALEHRGKAEPVITIYAPSSGIVLKRNAVPGKYVEPGTALYEIADMATVWIYADIYESEVAATRVGQAATVSFAAYPDRTFHGRVAYVYPMLNTEARTVRVRIELANPGLTLKPGMYGNVTLTTSSARALVIPKTAVVETGLRQLVFMDRGNGRYEPASIKVGRRSQDVVEVMEGLKEGDWIAVSANFLLDAESKLASASSMQVMMGRVGMGDWQMRGAHEGKMSGMDGMQDMPSSVTKAVSERRKVGGYMLVLTTFPEAPQAGEVLLRLKVTDQAGKPVTNAQVTFLYTMPMPGMANSKASAPHTKDGVYEGKAMFGMGGTWVVTANMTVPGQPSIAEKFQFQIAGGGM